MSRVQLALNVDDLDLAIEFYRRLFDTEPAKVRPGYANFAIADPPLKLVLIENPQREHGSLNHLGIEVESVHQVDLARRRLAGAGLATNDDSGECCHALQDKVWVDGPGGQAWEMYTVLADVGSAAAAGAPDDEVPIGASTAVCCAERPDLAAVGSPASRC
jgi:lactoylglutathione lyase